MPKGLGLYYSSYGHIEQMAKAAAEGVAKVAGVTAVLKRVPETMPESVTKAMGFKVNQDAPVATVDELADYDAIIFGTPTRYGNMAGQMKTFIDQTGALWMKGALVGKPGSVIASSATQHGGQETTITSFHTVLLHHGLVVIGLPYACQDQMGVEEVEGGSPSGATTTAGADGSRQPSVKELGMARWQGEHVAKIAAK